MFRLYNNQSLQILQLDIGMQATLPKEEDYLGNGDIINISVNGMVLSVEDFNNLEVSLVSAKHCKPLSNLFRIEGKVSFDDGVYLVHLLSGKYLNCGYRGVKLTSFKKVSCQLIFKSIYKCQTTLNRKLRKNEEVVIYPNQAKNLEEKIGWLAVPYRQKDKSGCEILIKRNELSYFNLHRINLTTEAPPGSLTTISLYQVEHVETDKCLSIAANPQNNHAHSFLLDFTKSGNQHETFLQIVYGQLIQAQPYTEKIIRFGQKICLRSLKFNKFLQITTTGSVRLQTEPNQNCHFTFEGYERGQLTEGSLIKIKHNSTNQYLSVNNTIEPFKLINVFKLKRIQMSNVRRTLFINQLTNNLKEQLYRQALTEQNKNKLKQMLVQLIKYIFGKLKVEQFLKMQSKAEQTNRNNKIKQWIIITNQEQDLLCEVNIIKVLSRYLQSLLKQSLTIQNIENNTIILYIMMATAGVCYNHPPNTQILIQNICHYYDAINKTQGAIECLYHIFSNNKQLLLILQTTREQNSQRQTIRSFDLLLEAISKQKYSYQKRLKIINLLQALTVSYSTFYENIQNHQISLLKCIENKKLNNIFLPIVSKYGDKDLIIKINNTQQELQELIMWKSKYHKQLLLLQAQLNLYASVCLNIQGSNVYCIRQIISQQLIFRYLSVNIYPEFRQIFMKLLIDLYLTNNNLNNQIIFISNQNQAIQQDSTLNRSLTVKFINSNNQKQIQLMSLSSTKRQINLDSGNSLQNIQNLILDVTKKSMKNQILDRSFYMDIKALKKFLEMNILDSNEIIQFKEILIQFVVKYHKEIFFQEEKRSLAIEIFKIFIYYEQMGRDKESKRLIQKFKNVTNTSSEVVYDTYVNYIQQSNFFNLPNSDLMKLLQIIIKESLHYQDQSLFYYCCMLLRLVVKRQQIMLDQLKDKIIIGSEWSKGINCRVGRIFDQLVDVIEQHKLNTSNNMGQLNMEQKMNQLIQQMNFLLYEWQDSSGKGISPLVQNLYRQIKIPQALIGFLVGNIKRVEQPTIKSIFRSCFDFFIEFIYHSQNNVLIFRKLFEDYRVIFTITDCGQAKFISKVLSSQHRKTLQQSLYKCIILCLQNSTNQDPNSYIILALQKIFIINRKPNSHKINHFVSMITQNKQLFMKLLKIKKKANYDQRYEWQYSSISSNNQQYHKSFSLYLLQLSKLLQIIIQQCQQKINLIDSIKKYISIQSILKQLTAKDLLQNISLQQLITTLMKKSLMKIFVRIYMDNLKQLSHQVQSILAIIQKIHQKLIHSSESNFNYQQLIVDELQSGRTSQQGKIITETYMNDHTLAKSLKNMFKNCYLSVNIYYPFLSRLLNTLLILNEYVQRNQHLKKQIQFLLDIMFRKFKEQIHSKLTFAQYASNNKQYQNSIDICEQMFRRKAGFNIVYEGNDDDQELFKSIEIDQVFIPKKLMNISGNYKCAGSPTEATIYLCIIKLFLSPKLREKSWRNQKKMPFTFSQKDLGDVFKLLENLKENKKSYLYKLVKIFDVFVNEELEFKENQFITIVSNWVADQAEDQDGSKFCRFLILGVTSLGSRLKRKAQFKTFSSKRKNYVNLAQQSQKADDIIQTSYSASFHQRIIATIQTQRELFIGYTFSKHANNIMENYLLAFDLNPTTPNAQLCLIWIRNKLMNVHPRDKQKFFDMIIAVIELLKAYCQFINQFKGQYVSKQLKSKIQLCISVLFQSITGLNMKIINYVIERQLWNEMNVILSLNDSLQQNIQQLTLDHEGKFRKIISSSIREFNKNYIQELKIMYKNTLKFYESSQFQWEFPLIPQRAGFSSLKKLTIAFIKQFKLLPLHLSNLFVSRINMALIDKNITQAYQKHQFLYKKFDIGSINTNINYPPTNQNYHIASNMSIENAIDLCSLKMLIQSSAGNNALQNSYRISRIQMAKNFKIQSILSSILTFIIDFFMLFISFLTYFCRRKSRRTQHIYKIDEAINFFLTKIGRIQVLDNNNIHAFQFLIRPQCKISENQHTQFINKVNFISVQLKLESIMKETQIFLLHFKNQNSFYRRFHRIELMSFLVKHFAILKWISYIIVLGQNITILVISSTQDQFSTMQLNQPFAILELINIGLSTMILFIFFSFDVPLIVAKVQLQLFRRANSYGSNFQDYSASRKFIIKYWKVVSNLSMIYHLLYTFAVYMIFYNKLFAAIVLLDVFLRLPTLINLIYAVSKPIKQLMLTILSFLILQYFFSIIIFFGFKSQTAPYCNQLQQCFGFIFVTTYKSIGGFVGYLFAENFRKNNGKITTQVTIFQLFQDFYVLLIMQIFFALILAIIIDSFSQIRIDQVTRRQFLQSRCIICNLNCTVFDSSAKISFRVHTVVDHSIWNYFYFYQYLINKDPLLLSDFERKIYENNDMDWIPNGFAKAIKEPADL